jgi:hypothetical protein
MNTFNSKTILLIFTILFFVFIGICFLKSFGIYEGFAEGIEGEEQTNEAISSQSPIEPGNETTFVTVTTKAKTG